MNRVEKAIELHRNGYNCSQSVLGAFSDLYNLDPEIAFKLSTSFGGGIGGSRNICGAVSGMALVAGLEYGTSKPNDKEGKKQNYEIVKALLNEFENEQGSINCGELLGLVETDKSLKKKPCAEYIKFCVELIEKKLLQHKLG